MNGDLWMRAWHKLLVVIREIWMYQSFTNNPLPSRSTKLTLMLLHKYLRHLSNFMTQGLHVIVLNPNLGRAAPGTEQELLRLANE